MKSEFDHRNEVSDELIARYLSGEADPEEAMRLFDALHDPIVKERFMSMQKTWQESWPEKTPRKIDKVNSWNELHEKLGKASIDSSKNNIRQGYIRYAIAAAVTLAVIASYFIYTSSSQLKPTLRATTDSIQQIELPDNSRITLNRNSSISYPDKFDSGERKIELHKGEAYFSVSRDEQKPFVIHTIVGNVKVLGTIFNVRLQNNTLEVGVAEGKVLVYTDYDSTILTAGSFATVKPSTTSIAVKNTVNANGWAYATRKFNFSDTPMDEIVGDLEKSFDLRITLQNEQLHNCRITAKFDNLSAEEMLHLIAEILNLTVIKNGDEFILEGQGCQ